MSERVKVLLAVLSLAAAVGGADPVTQYVAPTPIVLSHHPVKSAEPVGPIERPPSLPSTELRAPSSISIPVPPAPPRASEPLFTDNAGQGLLVAANGTRANPALQRGIEHLASSAKRIFWTAAAAVVGELIKLLFR